MKKIVPSEAMAIEPGWERSAGGLRKSVKHRTARIWSEKNTLWSFHSIVLYANNVEGGHVLEMYVQKRLRFWQRAMEDDGGLRARCVWSGAVWCRVFRARPPARARAFCSVTGLPCAVDAGVPSRDSLPVERPPACHVAIGARRRSEADVDERRSRGAHAGSGRGSRTGTRHSARPWIHGRAVKLGLDIWSH